jgi:hypothetical protein
MDSRGYHPDQDPPEAAALYLSALDHEHPYSEAELRHAIARAGAAVGRQDALAELYLQSVQGAGTDEYDVRARRRDWALRMARHLDSPDGSRPVAAATAPAWATWEEPVAAWPGTGAEPSLDPGPGPGRADALRELRTARRRPARIAAAVVGAQMAGVVLANEAPGFMATAWAGPLNVGLTLVVAQVVFTGWGVLWYVRHAGTSVEPLVRRHSASLPHLESRR